MLVIAGFAVAGITGRVIVIVGVGSICVALSGDNGTDAKQPVQVPVGDVDH
ncbi:hypothetical protein GS432_09785 [Rhodococcus hoagii]|nr:hypothetical protein [Prescottella equi]